jgi:hypothetical protein
MTDLTEQKIFEIIHLSYYENNTIDEIIEFFDGSITLVDIMNVINMSEGHITDIINTQKLSMIQKLNNLDQISNRF